ncbi:MAG: carbohydrate kinase [Clostridia bacterium]|nr:carbohydrate kinase [Clostridia bacterium]
MEKRFDICTYGELLIDFTESGLSNQGNPLYEANPGGAPCNVIAMLQKIGHKTAFIGKVGNDVFGRQLKAAIEKLGICSEGLMFDPVDNTSLAIVGKKPDGDRDFSFIGPHGRGFLPKTADHILTKGDLIRDSRIFHFGTASVEVDGSGLDEGTAYGVKVAQENGLLISFDPNYREASWSRNEDYIKAIEAVLPVVNILKISDNEIEIMTGKDPETGAKELFNRYPNIVLLLATLGKNGSIAFYKDKKVKVDAFLGDDTIETTGAGDTFLGGVLHGVLERGIDDLTEKDLEEMLKFAGAAAYLITTKKGALAVMPSMEDIERVLNR